MNQKPYIRYKHTTYYVDIETGEVLDKNYAETNYIIIEKYSQYETERNQYGRVTKAIYEHHRICKRSGQGRLFD